MKRRSASAGRMHLSALAASVLIIASIMGVARPVLAAEYLDAATTDVKPEDRVAVANPQPVQLLFQFATKGAPNAAATKYAAAQVLDTVRKSGLFSEVSTTPVANGAILSVVIDNVVNPGEMSDAAAKGAVTGATFFIAGSNVTDHYLCTIDYVSGPNASKITRTARHAMITQMVLINHPPENAVKIGSIKDAFAVMVRQIISNPLNAIAADPGFQPQAATAPAATPVSGDPSVPATASPPAETVPPAKAPSPQEPPAAAPAQTNSVQP